MNWDQIFSALRLIHIIAGALALITGYGALIVKRGGPQHRTLGRIYVYGMTIVVLTGLPMSIIHPNPFLFGIVIFTGYFIYSGRGAAINRDGDASACDYAAAGLLTITSLAALAAIAYVKLGEIEYSPTLLITGGVFAAIGIVIAFTDVRAFRAGPIRGKDRIIKHLTAMCAGLIATTTAVAVTLSGAVPDMPKIIAWLGPTAIVVPVIVYWSRQVRLGTFKF